jgi:hypothetical protein
MYLNATENNKQSAFLHSLGDAFNIYNVVEATQAAQQCILLIMAFHVFEQYGGKHTVALPWRRIQYLY